MSNEIKTGGRAFPWCGDLNETPFINLGMTLRDYFATKAMEAILTDHFYRQQSCARGYGEIAPDAAREAYEVADAMLAAREASGE